MDLLRRLFHRHRWTLHSHAIEQNLFGMPWSVAACIECSCGERRYIERTHSSSAMEAMVWLRAQVCSAVPSALPEQIGNDARAQGGGS